MESHYFVTTTPARIVVWLSQKVLVLFDKAEEECEWLRDSSSVFLARVIPVFGSRHSTRLTDAQLDGSPFFFRRW